jgi:choline dehydrogenase
MTAINTPDNFDYVIVGAGAAGCVLANRLSADAGVSVCLLESGPPDRNMFIHIPGGFIKIAYNVGYTWPFKTEPSDNTAGRRIEITHGRTLGGSTSINGFNCVRGQSQDYDLWEAKGNPGWGYAAVLPYFKRIEHRIGKGDPRYRGTSGPLPITDCDWRHPLCDAMIRAAHQLGVVENPDYNAELQEGAGYYQRWIHNGRRYSAARAFLRPVLARRNLDVRTNAHATRLIIEHDKVAGVNYASSGLHPLK